MRKITTPKLLFGIEGYDIGLLLLAVLLALLDIGWLNDRLCQFCRLCWFLLFLGVL